MPGRDDHVWIAMVCFVHGCIVYVALCIVCGEVLCDCGMCGVCFRDW